MPAKRLSAPIFISALLILCFPFSVQATTIDFEGLPVSCEFEFLFVLNGGSGYSFESDNGLIIDGCATYLGSMIGNGSDFVTTGDNALIYDGGTGIFNLQSLELGPIIGGIYGGGGSASGTIIGEFAAGGSSIINYSNLTTATTFNPGWSNLTRVIFAPHTSSAIDNIVVNVEGVIPLPTSLALLGLGLFGLGFSRRSR
jgi:hypothetical protein